MCAEPNFVLCASTKGEREIWLRKTERSRECNHLAKLFLVSEKKKNEISFQSGRKKCFPERR